MGSDRSKNRRTRAFKILYDALPKEIQQLSEGSFELFLENPNHPSLRLHSLKDTKAGKHAEGSFSVSITMNYRAVYTIVDGINVWYWIGTHAQYKIFTGSRK